MGICDMNMKSIFKYLYVIIFCSATISPRLVVLEKKDLIDFSKIPHAIKKTRVPRENLAFVIG